MANGIRTNDVRGLNKERGSKFCVGSRVRKETEEGWKIYRPKCYEYKDGDKSPKNMNDKNHQTSSQKFIQLFFKIQMSRT